MICNNRHQERSSEGTWEKGICPTLHMVKEYSLNFILLLNPDRAARMLVLAIILPGSYLIFMSYVAISFFLYNSPVMLALSLFYD